MADPPQAPAPAAAATADLESKEIWGDEAEQLDEEIMKVGVCSSFLYVYLPPCVLLCVLLRVCCVCKQLVSIVETHYVIDYSSDSASNEQFGLRHSPNLRVLVHSSSIHQLPTQRNRKNRQAHV